MAHIAATPSRIDLFYSLAGVLIEPLPGLTSAGTHWSLFEAAIQIAIEEDNHALRKAAASIATIPSESLSDRRKRYHAVLGRNASLSIAQYESQAVEGRLMGSAALTVEAIYRSAGLALAKDELPDHVSLELAFIAFLMEHELESESEARGWRSARRIFVEKHAGRWIPQFAEALQRSGDEVYQPIGYLLAQVLDGEMKAPYRRADDSEEYAIPVLIEPEACNLCSFCVQVCPTKALGVHETLETTSLLIQDPRCISCGKCVAVCPVKIVQLEEISVEGKVRSLFQSPRGRCPGCGSPTVSQAELKAIAAQIGSPRWLDYCMECRPFFLEETR